MPTYTIYDNYNQLFGPTVEKRARNIANSINPLTHRPSKVRSASAVHVTSDDIYSYRIIARRHAEFDARFSRCFYISESTPTGVRLVRSQRWFLGYKKYYVVKGKSCTCPFRQIRNNACKHILAVSILES